MISLAKPEEITDTLFLSRLTLNPRSREARAALYDLHALHRLIWRGFPDRRESDSPDVGRILFRLEAEGPIVKDGLPFVLVQSALASDWSPLLSATGGASPVLDADGKSFAPRLTPGQQLRFRLRATPTVRRHPEDSPRDADGNSKGKRMGLRTEEEQRGWLLRKGEAGGFAPVEFRVTPLGQLTGNQPSRSGASGRDLKHTGVDYDGVLRVTDPDLFVQTLAAGVGAGKAWGFGLLSVARAC